MSIFNYFQKKPVPVTILGGPFRGARMMLNPASSKRKIFGLYEYVLNRWLYQVLQDVEVIWDIGANDGYFTYGCAHVLGNQCKNGYIVSFEPKLASLAHLPVSSSWIRYKGITFEFISCFVGKNINENMTTLDQAYQERSFLTNRLSLVKIDVEGSEIEVLHGARELLVAPHHWVVEVHGTHLLAPVLKIFADAGRKVDIRRLQSHWLWGPETRQIDTIWVTTHVE